MIITQLPFPRFRGTKHAKDWTATETLFLDQWQVPKGTTVKLMQSEDFGICVIPQGTQDVRGFTIPRTIFRW